MEMRLRLWSGLVLATFVILHLINLSLGVFSVQAMEAMRRVLVIAWNSPLGMTILLGAVRFISLSLFIGFTGGRILVCHITNGSG